MLVDRGQTGCSRPPGRSLRWYHLPGGELGHLHGGAILLLGLKPTKIARDIHKDLTTSMFFITYFTANNLINQASVEKINWYVHTMEHPAAIKKCLATWWI